MLDFNCFFSQIRGLERVFLISLIVHRRVVMDANIALLRDLKRTSDRWNASSVVIEDYNIALQRSLDLEAKVSFATSEREPGTPR